MEKNTFFSFIGGNNNSDDIDNSEPEQSQPAILLGDLIQILAPSNNDIHDQPFFVNYIDEKIIELINTSTFQMHRLQLDENLFITDESITDIFILDRSSELGYARQQKLVPGKWIDIYFGGDVPEIITGQITDLEEDKIEITTYKTGEIFYLDFEYKGFPKDLPIDKIKFRAEPIDVQRAEIPGVVAISNESVKESSIEYNDDGESIIKLADGAKPDPTIDEAMKEIFLDANFLYGQNLEAIYLKEDVGEGEKRYGLDMQVNNLVDELLSRVPMSKRTQALMNRVHMLVDRFKELRSKYSQFDDNGNVRNIKLVGNMYKPLVKSMKDLSARTKWIIPVVSNKKYIYKAAGEKDKFDINDSDHLIVNPSMSEAAVYHQTVDDNFHNNQFVPGDDTKYEYYLKNMTTKPVELPDSNESHLLAFEKEIHADIEALVSNIDDFYTDVYRSHNISTVRYFIQKYNLGQNRVASVEYKNGVKVYLKKQVTPNDKMAIRSLVTLPYPVLNHSRAGLNATDIKTRAVLGQTSLYLFRIFGKNMNIPKHMVETFEKEIDFEAMENDNVSPEKYLSKVKEYVLDDDLFRDENRYEKFLKVVIPKIRDIIRLMKQYMPDKYTIVDIVKFLEPFLIYEDSITYGQYNEMRHFIKERITAYRARISEQSKLFNIMSNKRYEKDGRLNLTPGRHLNRIHHILAEDKEYMDKYEFHYLEKERAKNENEQKKVVPSSAEELLQIMSLDYGKLYYNMISSLLTTLITPDKLLDSFVNADLSEQDYSRDCGRKYLAKKYSSLAELHKDDHADVIYFDKEFDDTPYDIIKKYQKEKKEMLPEKFLSWLTEVLIQKHDVPANDATHLAKALIDGKKIVSSGHYAVVELKPGVSKNVDVKKLTEKERQEMEQEAGIYTKWLYYERVRNIWKRDESVNTEQFYDNNKLFCNVFQGCVKNDNNATCMSEDQMETVAKRDRFHKMFGEFENRVQLSLDEIKQKLQLSYDVLKTNLEYNRVLLKTKLYKSNYIKYELGQMEKEENNTIISPYAKLFDMILAQQDFAKRHSDIVKLVELFCREAIDSDESVHWYYCKQSHVKLVPKSLYTLASAFINGDDYEETLDMLCSEIGSDEGDNIVDKYSGYVLRKKEFVAQEEFDDAGFKVTRHAIIEKDDGVILQEALQKKKQVHEDRVFDDPNSEKIYNIVKLMCKYIDINHEGVSEFVVRFSSEMFGNTDIVLSEKKYNKKLEKMAGKDTKIPPYDIYLGQTMIIITACVLFVAIQTAVPEYRPKKTYQKCMLSFSGFPLTGEEDISGIHYIACILSEVESTMEPWQSIKPLSSKVIEKRMKEVITAYLLDNTEVSELYFKKREFLIFEKAAVDEMIVSKKWKQFLPPPMKFHVTNIQGLGDDFDEETRRLLTSQNVTEKGRNAHNLQYISNSIKNTYGIVESINDILAKKNLLLKTSTNKPFIDNACCNEKEKNTYPMLYFADEDKNIDRYIKHARKNGIMYRRLKQLSTADIYYNAEHTGIPPMLVPTETYEQNIYKAYIHYGNFDNDLPIAYDLRDLIKEKPNGYHASEPIEDKIHFLKSHGKRYDLENLHNLMKIVNRRNRVATDREKYIDHAANLKTILDALSDKDSKVISEPLRKTISALLSNWIPTTMIFEKDIAVTPFNLATRKLRNYLTFSNKEMHDKVMNYFNEHGNLDDSQYKQIESYLIGMAKWNIDKNIAGSGKTNDEGLYIVTNHIYNSLYLMLKLYPKTILLQTDDFIRVANHWGFSHKHNEDIVNILKQVDGKIMSFLGNKRNALAPLLESIFTWNYDIFNFISNLPVYTSIVKDGNTFFSLFDKDTIYQLYLYCWYTSVYEIMETTNDFDMLKLDSNLKKKENREVYEDKIDPTNITAAYQSLDETQNDMKNDIDEMIELEIKIGDRANLKKITAEYLIECIKINMNVKKFMDVPYDSINKKVRRTKQQEKKAITDFFEAFTDKDSRRIEYQLEQFGIGPRWNVGKEIYKYDKNYYDENREANMARYFEDVNDLDLGNVANGGPGNEANANIAMDVNDLAEDAKRDFEKMEEEEQYGIQDLHEDYADGVFYAEDGDFDGYD